MLALCLLAPGCAAKYSVPIAAGADIATTEVALSRVGYVEANPLLQERSVRISVKVAAVAIVLWLEHSLRTSGHTSAAAWLQWIATGLWSGAAAWNVHTLEGS